MTCSKNFGRLLQAASLGLIGMLAVAGCGGSESGGNKDSGVGGEVGPQTTGAALNLDRAAVNLGTIDVGGTGIATVTVTNVGKGTSGPVSVTASAGITATGCGQALAAGAFCTITITVTPTAAGSISGTVTVTANPGAVTPLVISVIGTVSPVGAFAVTPSTIDLGPIAVGVAAPKQTITVKAAVALADLSVSTSGSDVKIDRTNSTCGTTLAAGASCLVVVDFIAVAAGARQNSVVISGGGANGKVVTVPITATAQNPAKLVVNPTTAQLVATVGQASSVVTLGLVNTGDVATGLISPTLAGAQTFAVTATTCTVLAPLATCTISVVYQPTAVGTETATLTIAEANGSSVVVALTGVASGASALTITPATSDLGSVLVGATGPATVFTVTNTGGTATGLLAASVSSTDFLITNDTCSGTSLPAAGACTLTVALRPATVGAKNATLRVADPLGNPGVKTLTGVGISTAQLVATPAAIDFGSVRIGNSGTPQTVTVRNAGGSNSGVLSFTRGGNFAVFPITANTCSAALGPGATCTFTVNFTPTVAQSETASYTVTDGASSSSVAVSGNGLDAPGLSIVPSPIVKACMVETPTQGGNCFDETVIGGTSNTVVFTVTVEKLPAGMAETGAIAVALGGTNATDFTIVTDNCTGKSLLVGAQCTVSVAFGPTAVGARQASLNVTTANGAAAFTWDPVSEQWIPGGTLSVTLTSNGLALLEIIPLDQNDQTGATGLDFGQVPLLVDPARLKDGLPQHDYAVVVRGPNGSAGHASVVLNSLTDPSQPADFMYPGTNINPCNSATNEAVTLDFGTMITTPAPGVTPVAPPTNWSYRYNREFYCIYTVQFYPQSSKGDKTATIAATGSGGGADSKTLTGKATGVLVFDPDPATFGSWQAGSSTNTQTMTSVITLATNENDQTVTLTNYSSTASFGPVVLALGGANAANFVIVSDRCSTLTLAPGQSCTVTLAFITPADAPLGAKTALLTATAGTETAEVTLTANTVSAYNITVAPNPYDFGPVPQTNDSKWVAFTVTNPAASPRSAQISYHLLGAGLDDGGPRFHLAAGVGVNGHDYGTCGEPGTTALTPGSSCTIFVQFMPEAEDKVGPAEDPNELSETLVVTDDAKSYDVMVDLTGTVASKLSISPTAVNFPDTAEGAVSAPVTLTVTNNGSEVADLILQENTSIAPFSIQSASTCVTNSQLAPQGTCTLVVHFIGESGMAQIAPYPAEETDLIVFDYNTSLSGYAIATLNGRTIKPATLEAFGLDNEGNGDRTAPFPYEIDLGGVRKGATSAPVTLTFINSGSVATSAVNFMWVGSADLNTQDPIFKINTEAADSCTKKTSGLAPRATCTMTVYFAPNSGTATAQAGPRSLVMSAEAGGIVDLFSFYGYALNPTNSGFIRATSTGQPLAFHQFPGMTPDPVTTAPSQEFEFVNGSTAIAGAITVVRTAGQGTNTNDFEVLSSGAGAGANPCGDNDGLAASQSCTFVVRFHPTGWSWDPVTTAYRMASVAVQSVTGATLGVFGRMQSPTRLAITPTDSDAYDFGQVVTTTTASKAFTVSNVGETPSAALTFTTSVLYFAVPPGGCTGLTLAGWDMAASPTAPAATTCSTSTITASPGNATGYNEGTFEATDGVVTSNAPYASFTGVANTALAVNNTAMTFPAQAVGTVSSAQTITLGNGVLGSDTLDSGLLTIALADKTNFTLVGGSCPDLGTGPKPTGLPGGTECTAVVQFIPQTLPANGTFTTTLDFNATPGNAQRVNISGTAVTSLTTDPATSAVFGSTCDINNTSCNITVYNADGAPTTSYLQTSIVGGNYVIVEDTCVAMKLAGGQNCRITVAALFTANTPLKTATLNINGGAPGNSASLTLNSTAPTP